MFISLFLSSGYSEFITAVKRKPRGKFKFVGTRGIFSIPKQRLEMFKRQARSKLLDRLHKGVVVTCIGVTLYGCYLLGWRYYRYFAVVRPEIRRREVEEAKISAIEGSSGGDTGFRDLAPELKT